MRKSFRLFTVALSVFAFGISISSCGSSNADSQNVPAISDLEYKLRQIYATGVSQGAITTSYEEWLESIRGEDGLTPFIGENGNWWIGETDTNVRAEGKSAYELYCEAHPEYVGDLDQWLDDLVNGRLGDKEYHTVTFDSNGGSEVESQQVLHGEKVSKPEDPTKENCSFEGWYDENNDYWVFNGHSITSDITLHAEWKTVAELKVSPTYAQIERNDSFQITVEAYPEDATVVFASDDENIASVDVTGKVVGVSAGHTFINVSLYGYDISKKCSVEITEPDYDIWTSATEMSGTLTVGVSRDSLEFTVQMAEEFNRLTNSNVEFDFKEFNGYDTANNFPTGASSGPDVFTFLSDEAYDLYQLGALSPISTSDKRDYCMELMIDDSLTGATINSTAFGYPYAADYGVVMFYNKAYISDPSEIDTLPKLLTKAQELQQYVSFDYRNGYFGSGILHSYSNSEPLYHIDYTNTEQKISTSFNCEEGFNSAKVGLSLMTNSFVKPNNEVPMENYFASIIYTSRVREFKDRMGPNYGVMPVPYITNDKENRIGTHLETKYFGVNNALDDDQKELARNFARFMASEYVQSCRYYALSVQPTFKSLQLDASEEPHIAALNAQKAANSTVILESLPGKYYNAVSTFFTNLYSKYVSDGQVSDDYIIQELNNLDASIGN